MPLIIGNLNPNTQTVFGALNALGGPPQGITVPSAPTVVVTPGNTTLAVSWSVASDGGSPLLGWQARVYGAAEGTPPSYTQFPATSFGTTFTGLTNGTEYTVQVLAFNDIGTSTVTAVNGSPAEANTLPGPVTGLHLEPLNDAASISFTAPVNLGNGTPEGYKVTVKWQESGVQTVLTYTLDDEDAVLLGLVSGRSTSVMVQTQTSIGLSAPVTGFVTPLGLPAGAIWSDPPTNVVQEPYNGSALVSWTAPVDTGSHPLVDYVIKAESNIGIYQDRWYVTTDEELGLGDLINGVHWTVYVYARTAVGYNSNAAGTEVVFPSETLELLEPVAQPYLELPPAELPDGVFPDGYLPMQPGGFDDPFEVPVVPVLAPNVIAFYPIDDPRGTLEGVFSPDNWAGAT